MDLSRAGEKMGIGTLDAGFPSDNCLRGSASFFLSSPAEQSMLTGSVQSDRPLLVEAVRFCNWSTLLYSYICVNISIKFTVKSCIDYTRS